MKCEDALLLISGHMDGENTAEEEQALQTHLCACEECRRVLQAFEETNAGLVRTLEAAPEELCANVMASIKKETEKKKLRPWLSIAVAAALTLVIGVGAVVERPEEQEMPQTASVVQTYTMARGVSADAHAVAEGIVLEREAPVAVVRELYCELETCECETLDEGYVLYVMQDPEDAAALAERYGCALYAPIGESSASVSYALLAP